LVQNIKVAKTLIVVSKHIYNCKQAAIVKKVLFFIFQLNSFHLILCSLHFTCSE